MGNPKKAELWQAVQHTNKRMTAFHKLTNMPQQTVIALKCIKHCGEMHNNQVKTSIIAEQMMLSRPATTHLINDLEQKGYVERIMTSADRRVVYLKLTQEGEERLVSGEKKMMEFFDRIMDLLGEDDTDELIRLQNKLCDIITQLEEDEKTRKEESHL